MAGPSLAPELFKGRHFDQEIIVCCVRWYLTFKLSSRDLVQMMAERGIALAHTTIPRWVQRYVPDFEKRWKRYALPVGDSWRVDETHLKVRGQWVYRPHHRFSPEQAPGYGCRPAVLFPGDPTAWGSSGHYPGRLRRLASGRGQA